MPLSTDQPSPIAADLPALALGVHGSPFFLLNSDLTTAQGTNSPLEGLTSPENSKQVHTGGSLYRFLNVYIAFWDTAGQTLSTQPVIRAFGSTPNHKTSPSIDEIIQRDVGASFPPLVDHEGSPSQKIFPLIPQGYTNASTTTAVTFPSVTNFSLYSGATNDIKIFPPVSFLLDGATSVFVTVDTAAEAMTGSNLICLLGRFSS